MIEVAFKCGYENVESFSRAFKRLFNLNSSRIFNTIVVNFLQTVLIVMRLCESEIGIADIKMAIENTNGFMEHEKTVIEMLLQSKCFGLTLDIGHSHAVHDMDINFYQEHNDKLIHLHAHDAKGSSNHLALGDGEIDIKQRLQLAKSANARVVLETKTVKALTTTVSRLTQYL